jgi:hypothetical protein
MHQDTSIHSRCKKDDVIESNTLFGALKVTPRDYAVSLVRYYKRLVRDRPRDTIFLDGWLITTSINFLSAPESIHHTRYGTFVISNEKRHYRITECLSGLLKELMQRERDSNQICNYLIITLLVLGLYLSVTILPRIKIPIKNVCNILIVNK